MKHLRSWAILLVVMALATAIRSEVIITEFMARNDDTIADASGEYSDWIELYHTGDAAISLEGWHLTDSRSNLRKWRFPPVVMTPGTFLVVFATGRDLRDPEADLHTNFRLSADGEYLALVEPDGLTIASEFRPFPPQVGYASYGVDMNSIATTVVRVGDVVAYRVPTDDSLGLEWTARGFNDLAWSRGPTGIGFDQTTTPAFGELIETDIGEAMRGVNPSVYVRIPFTVPEPATVGALLLRAQYEDGMVVFVNGQEAARRNLRDDEPVWDARGTTRQEADALEFELINLSASLPLLEPGENVLAIQGLNSSTSNSDLLLVPVLEIVEVGQINAGNRQFFGTPSPGWPNTGGVPALAGAPEFSADDGVFTESFRLEIRGPAGREIRYTLDMTLPDGSSTLYTDPILIESTMMVTARVFEAGRLPSPPARVSFVQLDERLLGVDSNLPIVVLNTFGRRLTGSCNKVYNPTLVYIVDRGEDGRAGLAGPVHYAGHAGLRPRGASTCSREKQSWNLEFRDETGTDLDVHVLGFTEESDFVLYGAYDFDHALIRNAFIYEISNQVGRWAPETRPVEVYMNQGTGKVTQAHYWGVYSFMEKIKQGPDRVDVDELHADQNTEPEVTGGYIFKIDRANDPGDITVPAPGAESSAVLEYPLTLTSAQRAWLTARLTEVNSSLSRADPLELGRDVIDVDSWIDHHILMTFPKNVDAFRLSGYLHMSREGLVERGPIWDYDRSMGSTDGRDRIPTQWANTGGDGGTLYFRSGWYGRLFKGPAVDAAGPPPLGDDEWAVRYRARWGELRDGPLSTDNMHRVIDAMAEEIGESADRNFNRWRQGNFQVAINNLKDWLATRADWIDSQFIEPPLFSRPGGPQDEPLEIALSTREGEVWYTVNGPDPRAPDGTASPLARRYTTPISVSANTRIWARTRAGERVWSEAVKETYVFELMPLVVTEVMYNPPEPAGDLRSWDHEFIEIANVGAGPLDLRGVRFEGRVEFDFTGSDVTALAPGEHVVIVYNREAFTAVYGDAVPIAGVFEQRLSDSAMTIHLIGPVDETLVEFTYDDDWEPTTDGGGYSLVIRDPRGPRENWDRAEGWRASAEPGGSPGRPDGGPSAGRQIPGDINQDARLNLTDAVGLLRYLFQGGVELPCTGDGNRLLLDMNGDGLLNVTDPVALLGYLFQNGAAPALGVNCVPIDGCPTVCEG